MPSVYIQLTFFRSSLLQYVTCLLSDGCTFIVRYSSSLKALSTFPPRPLTIPLQSNTKELPDLSLYLYSPILRSSQTSHYTSTVQYQGEPADTTEGNTKNPRTFKHFHYTRLIMDLIRPLVNRCSPLSRPAAATHTRARVSPAMHLKVFYARYNLCRNPPYFRWHLLNNVFHLT